MMIDIDLGLQRLDLREANAARQSFDISSSKNGAGEQSDSYCTPRGWHEVCEKIGDGCALNTVFVGRRPTGEIYSAELKRVNPERDWMLTPGSCG